MQVEELLELHHLEEFCGRLKDVKEVCQLRRRWQNLAYNITVQQWDAPRDDPFDLKLSVYNRLCLVRYDMEKLVKDEDGDILDVGIIRHLTLWRCEGSSNSLMDVFVRLINPTSLESLDIAYCQGIEYILRKEQFGRVGEWPHHEGSTSSNSSAVIMRATFASLTKLEVYGCKNINRLGISVLQLPNLVDIRIKECEEIEEIFEEVMTNDEAGGGGQYVCLPSLKYMVFRGLPKLRSICNATIVCASLQRISLSQCESLNKFQVVFGQPDYDASPQDGMRVELWSREKKWWEKLELGHPTHHSLLNPFIAWLDPR